MPYFRRNRRYRKSNNKLTKSNIYANRSARAQSRQIAKLNSKVNYIRKSLKPEILVGYLMNNHTFTNSSISLNWDFMSIYPWMTFTHTDNASSSGGTFNIQGNQCRSKGLTVRLVSQYSDNWNDSLAATDHDQSAGYRILILQRRAPMEPSGGAQGLQINNFIQSIPNSITASDDNLVAPLAFGINQYWKVLFSKTYTISRQNPTRYHTIKIPGNKMLNFIRDVSNNSSDIVCKGIVYILIITGGLHYDTSYSARISMNWSTTLAFTDQ